MSTCTRSSATAPLFDGHRYRGALGGVVVRRPDRGGHAEHDALGRPGPDAASSTSRVGCWRPASPTPTCTRSRAAWSGCAATCPSTRPARSTSPRSARTPTATPTWEWILGGGWAMPAFPGGTPLAADLDTVVPDRPVFLPNRDHHGAWVNSRARWRSPGSPGTLRTRRTAGSSGTPTASRRGTLHEGATALVSGTCPAPPEPTTARRCSPARPTCTRSASPAGRTRSSAPTPAWTTRARPTSRRRASGELRSHVVGALWWDRTPGRRAGRRPGRPARGADRWPVPRHHASR